MQHAVIGVEETISAIVRRFGSNASHSSLLSAFISGGIVMDWVSDQPHDVRDQIHTSVEATINNVALLNGLWDLFAKHGITIRTPDKIALLESYLGDT